MPETATTRYQRAIRAEQERRWRDRRAAGLADVVALPPVRATIFTGSAGL